MPAPYPTPRKCSGRAARKQRPRKVFVLNALNRFYLSLRDAPRSHRGIEIYFDHEEEFTRVAEALDLAARVDPLRFGLIQRFAPRILTSRLGTGYFDEGTQSANLNLAVLTGSYQIASMLVHGATHGWLHSRGVRGTARHQRAAHYQMTRFVRRYQAASGLSAEEQRAWREDWNAWVSQSLADTIGLWGRLRYLVKSLGEGVRHLANAFRGG